MSRMPRLRPKAIVRPLVSPARSWLCGHVHLVLLAASLILGPVESPLRAQRPLPGSNVRAQDRNNPVRRIPARPPFDTPDGRVSNPRQNLADQPARRPQGNSVPLLADNSQTESESQDAVERAALSLTLEEVERQSKEASSSDTLTEEDRTKLEELFTLAAAHLDRADQSAQRATKLAEQLATAESRAADIASDLEATREAKPTAPAATDVPTLQRQLQMLQDQLMLLQKERLSLDQRSAQRSALTTRNQKRLSEIPDEEANARILAEAMPATGEAAAISNAKRTEALCRLKALLKERPELDGEIALFEKEAALKFLQVERNLNAELFELRTQEVKLVSDALQRAREEAAGSVVEEAVEAEEQVPVVLRPIAEKSLQIAEQNQTLVGKLKDAERLRTKVDAQLAEIQQTFLNTKSRFESVNLTASVGALLRNERRNLPDVRALKASITARRPEVDEAQLAMFDLMDQQARIANLSTAATRELAELDPPAALTDENLARVTELIKVRVDVLDTAFANQEAYFNTLNEISIAEGQLAKESKDFRDYIDQRVLWIRSHPPALAAITQADWNAELEPFRVSYRWPNVVAILIEDAKLNPVLYCLALVLAGFLIAIRPYFRARLASIADQARRSSYSQFAPSLAALLMHIVGSLFGPFVLGFVAYRIGANCPTGSMASGVANGLSVVAMALLPLSFFSRVFAVDGLGDAHFDLSKNAKQLLRANLRWMVLLLLPVLFASNLAASVQRPTCTGIVHRVLALVACVLATLFVWRLAHPHNGLPRRYIENHQDGWLGRLKHLWFAATLLVPITMGALVLMGYAYTARELSWRCYQTLAIGGVLWVFHALIMRLLLVHRRRLAIESARARFEEFKKKRAAEQQAEQQENAETMPTANKTLADFPGVRVTTDGIVIEEDPLADLRANTAQSRRLVSTVFLGTAALLVWMTWHNVLPALNFLERWPIWQSTRQVVQTKTNESGDEEEYTVEMPDPVTIADLTLAIVIVIVGWVAARNLPGLLELAILNRLPLENSVRYAVTTLSSYGLIFVGLFAAFRLLGLRWQQIQWMATALTFGLAFGLQEIFANFVAGIIILFERPIRVGDIVTIDDVTGVVSKLRMRATTVTNWDRKDYIVPNRDFITGRLLNWTLSDHVNRIVITVGVAYGTDTTAAKRILVEAATEHPVVVDDPAPMATFEEFADSTLNLVLRCFIAMKDMPMRLDVVDQLHSEIDTRFKAASIEIAFPQRDLHIRQVPDTLIARK